MIRDLSESKRVNNQCSAKQQQQQQQADEEAERGGEEGEFSIDATVISYLFWPNLREEEKLNLPPAIAE